MHHSFAEFLAARAHSHDIGADFPDIEKWINLGLKEAQRNFVLFTIGLWSRAPVHDIGLVLRHLIEGDAERLIFAGHLLGEGVAVDGANSEVVVNRLIDLALGASLDRTLMSASSYHSSYYLRRTYQFQSSEQVFSVLGKLTGHQYAADRLASLVARRELPPDTRVGAAIAYGFISDTKKAVQWLEGLLNETSKCEQRLKIALGLRELSPESADAVRSILLKVGRDAQCNTATKVQAAEELARVGAGDIALELAKAVLVDENASRYDLKIALGIAIAQDGQEVIRQLVASHEYQKEHQYRQALVSGLAEAGCTDMAVELSRELIADKSCTDTALGAAVKAWLQAGGSAAVDQVSASLDARSHIDPWARSLIASAFAEQGSMDNAATHAKATLADPGADSTDTAVAARAWISAVGADAIVDVWRAVKEREQKLPDSGMRLEVIEVIADLGHASLALQLLTEVLSETDDFDVVRATDIYCTSGGADAAADILPVIERQSSSPERVAACAAALARGGQRDLAHRLINDVLELVRKSERAPRPDLLANAAFGGPSIIDQLVRLVPLETIPSSTQMHLSLVLAETGAISHATDIWMRLLTDMSLTTADSMVISSYLVSVARSQQAIDTLRVALGRTSMTSVERSRLRQLLAWTVLADPSAEGCGLCSDVGIEE
ncbi:hypothetical protein GCM10009733_085680 [Nonomuraea maheshkhaliensis]|uniref:HEAT repeat domain-containing protein n=1 Tax=Nonomuraea maheshkhaliensis TaxID=419590 RepID=A0ABP4SU00_9ACTN